MDRQKILINLLSILFYRINQNVIEIKAYLNVLFKNWMLSQEINIEKLQDVNSMFLGQV